MKQLINLCSCQGIIVFCQKEFQCNTFEGKKKHSRQMLASAVNLAMQHIFPLFTTIIRISFLWHSAYLWYVKPNQESTTKALLQL